MEGTHTVVIMKVKFPVSSLPNHLDTAVFSF